MGDAAVCVGKKRCDVMDGQMVIEFQFEFEFEFEFELGERWREVCDTCVWYFGWTISHGKMRREGRIWEKEKREMVFDGFVLLLVYVYAECWVSRYLLTYLVGGDSFTQCVLYVLCMCLFPQTPETIGMERILFGGNEWMGGWRNGGMEGWICMHACMYVCME